MRNHALEILVQSDKKTLSVWLSSPKYGEAHMTFENPVKTVTLSDGKNRVKVAVYNYELPTAQLISLARLAIPE